MQDHDSVERLRWARIVLAGSMLVMGACGIIYEYTLGVLGNHLMGSSHEQIFVIIGIMLFAMGLGSALQRQVTRDLIDRFLAIELLLGLVGGMSTLVIYTTFVHSPAYPLALYGFALIIGVLIGLEIPLLIRINQTYNRSLRSNLSEILSMDYVGALVGALLFAYVLISRVSVSRIGVALGCVNALIGLLGLLYFWPLVRRRRVLLGVSAGVLVLLGVSFTQADRYMASLEQRCYRDPIVHRETSPYQHLVLTKRGKVVNLYINGHLQFSSRDEVIYHELLVHVPMALARRRDEVLILGGGDGLALREILRYRDVRRVTLVDIDPAVTRLAASDPDLVALDRGAFHDARVCTLTASGISPGPPLTVTAPTHLAEDFLDDTEYDLAEVRVVNVDADLFVRDLGEGYDVVIADFPDPSSIEVSKLFSVDFYRALSEHLHPGATLGIQATSPWHTREAFLSIGESLRAAGLWALPYHDHVPSFGEWGFYVAWVGGAGEADVRDRLEALEGLPVETRYLTPDVLRTAFVFGRGWLSSEEEIRPNTRMRPVLAAYYRRGWK